MTNRDVFRKVIEEALKGKVSPKVFLDWIGIDLWDGHSDEEMFKTALMRIEMIPLRSTRERFSRVLFGDKEIQNVKWE